MNASKFSKLDLFKLALLGAFIGGLTGTVLLLTNVFAEPITEFLCALSGAIVLPTVANFARETYRLTEESMAADCKRKDEEKRLHDIGGKLLAVMDEATGILTYLEPALEGWIAERRQPDGSICRSGEVVELWAYTPGAPMDEVRAQITRNRSARWLGTFSDTQIVAILAE
ncbi:MAG: hypothetical protein U0103_28080 [Candidatus Obscuribacterales bacterium]